MRIVLAVGVALWSVATLLTGFVTAFAALLLLRLLLGLGESVTFPGVQLLLARHTHERQRGTLMGLITMGQGVGPMCGTLFGGLLMAQFGWRALFITLGAITLLWLLPWLYATRSGSIPIHVEEHGSGVSYAAVLRRRDFWGTALGHFGANYAFYFIISWLPTFLVKFAGFSVAEMATIGAVIYAIYSASVALTGAASDAWVRRGASITLVRKTFMLTSMAGAALTIAGCAYVEPRNAIWLLFLAGVFFGFATPMIFAIGATLAGPRLPST